MKVSFCDVCGSQLKKGDNGTSLETVINSKTHKVGIHLVLSPDTAYGSYPEGFEICRNCLIQSIADLAICEGGV